MLLNQEDNFGSVQKIHLNEECRPAEGKKPDDLTRRKEATAAARLHSLFINLLPGNLGILATVTPTLTTWCADSTTIADFRFSWRFLLFFLQKILWDVPCIS